MLFTNFSFGTQHTDCPVGYSPVYKEGKLQRYQKSTERFNKGDPICKRDPSASPGDYNTDKTFGITMAAIAWALPFVVGALYWYAEQGDETAQSLIDAYQDLEDEGYFIQYGIPEEEQDPRLQNQNQTLSFGFRF